MWKNDPLDRPDPMPTMGDKSRNELFVRIGTALNQWEHTEEGFAMLFGRFVLPERPIFPAYRAYGAIASATGRSEALKAAAAAFFHTFPSDDLQTRLDALMKRYPKASARRNEIAHGIVVGSHVGHGQTQEEVEFLGYFLYPSMYSERIETCGKLGAPHEAFELLERDLRIDQN